MSNSANNDHPPQFDAEGFAAAEATSTDHDGEPGSTHSQREPLASSSSAGQTPENQGGTAPKTAGKLPDHVEKMQADREEARQARRRRSPSAMSQEKTGTPTPGVGGRAPFQDPRLAAQEASGDGPPPWLGTRWREIKPEHQREAWIGLRRWVDWYIHEYQINAQVIPNCWYLHPNMVQELYAAMCMEHKAWEEGAASLTPMMMWHPNVQAMNMRLREMVAEHSAECAKGNHKPVERMERTYDEDTWRRVAYGWRDTTTVERPGPGKEPYLMRARFLNDAGNEVGTSEQLVGIAPIKHSEHSRVDVRQDRTTAATDSIIPVEAYSVPAAKKIVWEKAEQWETDENGHITDINWTPLDPTGEDSEEEPSDDDKQPAARTTPSRDEISEESRL